MDKENVPRRNDPADDRDTEMDGTAESVEDWPAQWRQAEPPLRDRTDEAELYASDVVLIGPMLATVAARWRNRRRPRALR